MNCPDRHRPMPLRPSGRKSPAHRQIRQERADGLLRSGCARHALSRCYVAGVPIRGLAMRQGHAVHAQMPATDNLQMSLSLVVARSDNSRYANYP